MDVRTKNTPVDQAVRLQVQDLIAHYVDVIDQDRLDEWPELFTEKCHYRITSAEGYEENLPYGVIYADSRSMLRDRVSALREANIYEAQRYRHLVGPIWVEAVDAVKGVLGGATIADVAEKEARASGAAMYYI